MKFMTATLCIFAVLLCSCGIGAVKQKADAVMQDYYSKLQRDDIQGLLPLLSDGFLQTTPPEKYLKLMTGIRSKMGVFKSYSLANWRVSTKAGTGAGRYVTLVYSVTYERGEGTETFVLFEPPGSSSLRIQSYDLRSEALIENKEEPPPPQADRGNA